MATFTSYCNSGSKKNRYGVRLTVTENSWDVNTNQSNITITFQLGGAGALGLSTDYTGSSFTGYTCTGTIYVNGTQYASGSSTAKIANNTVVTLASWTGNVGHNTDGTLSLNCSGTFTGGTSDQANGGTAGGNVTFTTIPRYFSSTPSISLKSRTETTMTYTWSTSEYCNGLTWNGGGTLTGFSSGTSGTVTITGLTNNKSYSHYGTFKRSDSGLTTNSNTSTNSTYDYPYVTTVTTAALNIGSKQKLALYNPLSRSVTVRMNKDSASGTQLYSGSTSTTSIEFTPSTSTLYGSITTAKSGKCVYTVAYGNTSTKSTTGSYTYNCVESDCSPQISAKTATDTTNQGLTGSSSKLIINLSKPAVSMTANARQSATISSYKITCGSQVINSSSGTFGSVITTNTITYSVTDSRGYTTTQTLTPSAVTYITLTVSPTFKRNQPTDGKVNLNYSGNFFNGYFGGGTSGTQNTIAVSWRYKVKDAADSTYSDWTALSPTASGNTYSQNVGNIGSSYDYTKAYTFQIKAIDKINTSGYTVTVDVSKGQPVFWWNNDGLNVPTKIVSTGTKMTVSTSGMPSAQPKGTTAMYRDGIGFYSGGNTSGNDGGFIRFNEDTTNSGYMEICTGDDGTEPIYARQYNGSGVARTATLLDGSGNTSFPGLVSAKVRNVSQCVVGSDTASSNGWYKVCSSTMSGYGNADMTWLVQDGYGNGYKGILSLEMRSNNGSIQCWQLKWLVRSGFAYNHARVTISGNTWTLYIYRSIGQYGRIGFIELSNTNINSVLPAYTVTYYNSTTKESSEPTASATSSDNSNGALSSYPVGSIYMSANITSPASLFGGTWVRLTSRFLYASAASSGAKGQSDMSSSTGTNVTSTSVNHYHGLGSGYAYTGYDWVDNQNRFFWNVRSQSMTANRWTTTSAPTYTTGSKGFSIATNLGGTTDTDGLGAHNHAVPYISVYVWQRTA